MCVRGTSSTIIASQYSMYACLIKLVATYQAVLR